MNYMHNVITNINTSKLFAGLIIIILNISSKFVTIKLGKTVEAYLKYTFSKQILVFAIAWMGTRDIYIALLISFVFIFLFDYILNDESRFCCLPASFMDYHLNLIETEENKAEVTDDEIKKAKDVLEKAEMQKNKNSPNSPNSPVPTLNNVHKNDIFPFSPLTA